MGLVTSSFCCLWAAWVLLQQPGSSSAPQEKPTAPAKPAGDKLEDLPLPPNAVIVIPKDSKQALQLMQPGGIILSPEQYKALLDKTQELEEKLAELQKKTPARKEPVISQCVLTGQVKGDVLDLRAELTFKTSAENQLVPVGFRGQRFTSAKLDGETPVWGPDLERLAVSVREPRVYQLVLEMQVKVSRAGGKRSVSLELPASAIGKLELSFDERIEQARLGDRSDPLPIEHAEGPRSSISAQLPVSTQLDLGWRAAGVAAAEAASELLVAADLRITVDENSAETAAALLLECRRGSVSSARFFLGESRTAPISVLEVMEPIDPVETGAQPKRVSWEVEGGRVLAIGFDPPLTPGEKPLALRVLTRQTAAKAGGRLSLGRLALESPLEKSRQRGTIAVAAAPGVRVQLQTKDLSPIELRDLPPSAAVRDADLVGAFRYWRQPVDLDARVELLKPVVEARVSQQWHLSDTVLEVSAELSFETARPGVELIEVRWPRELTLDRVSPIALVERADLDAVEPVLLLRLTRRQQGTFKLRLEGSLLTTSASGVSLALPVPLRARRNANEEEAVPVTLLRGEEQRLSMSEEMEAQLAAGTAGLTAAGGRALEQGDWLREPTTFFLAPADRTPPQLALQWRPRRWPVQSQADIWLTRNAIKVKQTLTYSFRAVAPGRVFLRVPRSVDGLLTAREKGLSDRRRPLDENTVERTLHLPRGLSGEFKVVLEYEKRVGEPADAGAPWLIPLVSPSEGVMEQSLARLWATSGLRLAPAPGTDWVPVSSDDTAIPLVSPDLRLSRSGSNDSPLRVLAEPIPADAGANLVAERVLVEALVADDVILCRACFQLATVRGDEIELRWPTSSEALQIERVRIHLPPLGGDEATERSAPFAFEPSARVERRRDQDETVLRIPIEPFLLERRLLLEVRYQAPGDLRNSGLVSTIPVPRPEGMAAVGPVRWRVELPQGRLPIWTGGRYVPEDAWRWQGWLRTPQLKASAAEMTEWVRGDAATLTPGDDRASWNYSGVAELSPLAIAHVSRRAWLATCSLAALTAGLAVCLALGRLRIVWLALPAAGALGLFLSPLWLPFVYGAQTGLAVLAVLLLILWVRKQRWRRQVVWLPGFTRLKVGSSLTRAARPLAEPSTVDAPKTGPSPSSKVRA